MEAKLKIPTREQLPAELSKLSGLQNLRALLFHWGMIAGSIALAVKYPGPLTFLLNLVVVGTRQHALFIVMHEGTHYLLSKNRALNDWLSDLCAAWPVGISTARYRVRHWLHHRYLNTQQDPDWERKKDDPAWQFPTSRWGFWKTSLPYLVGKGVIEMGYALKGFGVNGRALWYAIPYYMVAAAGITYVGGWKAFALYWLVPYVSVNPALHRFRYSTEHMALPKTHVLNSTRNVVCSGIENFLISPMNGGFHLVHHTYPYIPWYNLPEAYEVLHGFPVFHEHAYELDGYFPTTEKNVFHELVGVRIPVATKPVDSQKAA